MKSTQKVEFCGQLTSQQIDQQSGWKTGKQKTWTPIFCRSPIYAYKSAGVVKVKAAPDESDDNQGEAQRRDLKEFIDDPKYFIDDETAKESL